MEFKRVWDRLAVISLLSYFVFDGLCGGWVVSFKLHGQGETPGRARSAACYVLHSREVKGRLEAT
jgi:heme A synthase